MSKNRIDITILAEKAKSGNSTAIDELVNHFHRDIFKMVYYRTGSIIDSEDITQEIFIKMVKSVKSLRDTKIFKAWLYRIAVNKITDYYRKRSFLSLFISQSEPEGTHTFPHELNDDSNSPSNALLKKEFYSAFFEFTGKLAKREKEVFLLRFIDQLGIKEIAQVIDKNQSTVKTHLYRAINKFKENNEFRKMIGENYEK